MQNDEFGQQDFIPILSWTWILHPACMFGFKLLIKTWVFNFNIKSYRSQWFSCLKYLFLLWKWIFVMVWKNNENSYKWCKLWFSPMLWCPVFQKSLIKKQYVKNTQIRQNMWDTWPFFGRFLLQSGKIKTMMIFLINYNAVIKLGTK